MKVLKWCSAAVAAGLLLQFIGILLVPNILMTVLWHRLTDPALDKPVLVNRFRHLGLANADSDFVVRPSPDLLYSLCLYDLSEGPVQISGRVPNSYWSLQLYGMNTDNFAGVSNTRNQVDRAGKTYRITLVGPEQAVGEDADEIIRAPENRGLALVRMAAIGQSAEQLQAVQQQAICQPLSAV